MISQFQDNSLNINENDILIIGGGKSILNSEIGSVIDSFPTIGRINNYETNNCGITSKKENYSRIFR